MHPTSLPGPYGIGDLGDNLYKFIDFMAASGSRLWQIMPLGPTGYGDSPYACFSAIAGNPLMISPDRLITDGLLSAGDLRGRPKFPADRVDFGPVINYKYSIYEKAFANFKKLQGHAIRREYDEFCEENLSWLDDFALFMALKGKNGGAMWSLWAAPLVKRESGAIDAARRELSDRIEYHKFLQFAFFRQWKAAKAEANRRGIKIVGDVPIFVAYDSADVWVHPELFHLDPAGKPTVVAGVPPDYFSKTGQLWGNPLYRWDSIKKDGFGWWITRFKETLKSVDIIRIDHFRGFEAYWEVPASEKTAVRGKWVKAPGTELFEAVREGLGNLPIIAEDLGVITPEVEKLRDDFGFAGMKILQFAFGSDPANQYLPHNYVPNSVVYSGTHDNETTIGWFENISEKEKEAVLNYTDTTGKNINWDFIRLAAASVSDIAVVPVQDISGAGVEGRMNTPGKASGNWSYRFKMADLKPILAEKLAQICHTFGR